MNKVRVRVGATVVGLCGVIGIGVRSVEAEVYQPRTVHDVDLLENSNLLVTDGGVFGDPSSGGIYEIDRNGNILWSYTTDLDWAHNADRQADGSVIISDTGNERVLIIDQSGAILWNTDMVTLSDGSTLSYPNDANLLPSGNRLITDRDNHRVIEIDADGNVVWQFGQTGLPGGGPVRLAGPHNADRLDNGNTIIADSANNRVIEVNPTGTIVWTYASGLNWPRDADRLSSGNTLINDSSGNRVIEVTLAGAVVWSHSVSGLSYDSDRLASGNTLIGTQDGIYEVDAGGSVVWSYPIVYETEVVEGYFVTAPNENQLWTRIIQPRSDLYPGEAFPTVVNVPGGLGAGEGDDLRMASWGWVELHFNAEGRGVLNPSEGVEDYNGFIHQADLKAVIEYAHTLPNVQDDNLGVVTGSYGITMGSGCLGRFPQLQVKYLVDQEGPSESFVTCFEPWTLDADPTNDKHENAFVLFGHYSECRDPSQENVDFWSQRQAKLFIGNMRCRYVRIQAAWDHAQPPNAQWPGFDFWPCSDPCTCWYPNKHCADLVNLTTLGRSPWTRVNDASLGNAVDATYDGDNEPVYYSGWIGQHSDARKTVLLEMAAMPPLDVAVPTVSGWGMAIMTLLVLVSASILIGRPHLRRKQVCGVLLCCLVCTGNGTAEATPPIQVLIDVHADPMGGPPLVQQQTYQSWVDATNWLMDVAQPPGAKISFLSTGQ